MASVSIGLAVLCVVYFLLLDRWVFSTAGFAQIFRHFLKQDDAVTAWVALGIGIAAAGWRGAQYLAWSAALCERRLWVVCALATLCMALCALFVYHAYPLSMDEYAALFQAKIFAAGHIVGQLPRDYVDWLVVKGFNGEFLIASHVSGKVIEQYWPGFSLLLAPFEWLNLPWTCNPALALLGLAMIYRIVYDITADRRAACWGVVFAFVSTAYVAYAMSLYAMQAHLTANLVFVALLLKPSTPRCLLAGLVGSLALVLHNPVPHAAFAAPWVLALAFGRESSKLWPLLAGYVPGVAVGIGWLWLRGTVSDLGTVGQTAAHVTGGIFTWPDWTQLNMRSASVAKMLLWAMPGLFVLAAQGFRRWREVQHVQLLAWSFCLTFVVYLFVRFDQGHGWGYRYIHSAWGVVPIMAGCAMARAEANPRLVSFAAASAVLSLVVLMPLQLWQMHRFVASHLAQLGAPVRPGNNIYFIHPLAGFYLADMVQNDPYLRAPDLNLVSHGAALDEQFVKQRWPAAIQISSDQYAEQWYLGPQDQRPFILPSAADH